MSVADRRLASGYLWRRWSSPFVGLLIVCLSVVGGVVGVFPSAPLVGLGIPAAIGVLAVGFHRPVWLAIACIAGTFVLDFAASWGIVPKAATWLPETAIVLLGGRLALLRLGNPIAFGGVSRLVDLSILALIAAAVISAVGGSEHPITTILGLRGWFILILLLYVILNDEDLLRARNRLWWMFWALVAVQPLPVTLQWLSSDCRNCYVDAYFGTLMSTATLAIVGAMAASCGLAFYLERGQTRWLVLQAPMLVAFGLADAKGGFAMVAGSIGAVLMFRILVKGRLRSKGRLATALVLAPAMLLIGVELATRNLGLDVSDVVFNPRALTEYKVFDQATGQDINRAFDLNLAWRAAAEHDGGRWFGAGPGAGSESSLPQYVGSVYQQHAFRIGRSVFWVQGGRLLVELGLLGVIGTVVLAVGIVLLACRGYLRAVTTLDRAVSLSLIGQVVVFVMAHFYQTLHDVPRLGLWLSVAVVAGGLRQPPQGSVGVVGGTGIEPVTLAV